MEIWLYLSKLFLLIHLEWWSKVTSYFIIIIVVFKHFFMLEVMIFLLLMISFFIPYCCNFFLFMPCAPFYLILKSYTSTSSSFHEYKISFLLLISITQNVSFDSCLSISFKNLWRNEKGAQVRESERVSERV